ncbi:uncharacterized protein VICG_00210 [Vittaforma corneae ATCC 50505]|uniref:ORMDL family protein n=1 Tax=Vittaforma corneae (strain ATCC 50505) TaxID=993615 RepID=L2GQV1_VITCO|nr:uncharacterized protein VICG_00210 [Vittaforma corneae ATCC 50505]ELA42895.1 hypothetical protein VICG_00210 [Vittaforma corneae ATCC 50505]
MKSDKGGVGVSSNVAWTIQKGSWLIHFVLTGLLAMFLTQILGKNLGLQVSVISYNIGSFIFFHWIVGDPFNSKYNECTFWEQMAIQLGHSSSLIFLALYPVLLFMIVHRMVEWDMRLLIIAGISLLFVVIPKLGFMHMKRVFGIKRYD